MTISPNPTTERLKSQQRAVKMSAAVGEPCDCLGEAIGMTPPVPTKGSAFLKGGFGCLGAFAVVAVLVLIIGGSVHIDCGGMVCLFVIGGIIGLIGLACYRRGRHDAGDYQDDSYHFEG
jgi:hypothetical protein